MLGSQLEWPEARGSPGGNGGALRAVFWREEKERCRFQLRSVSALLLQPVGKQQVLRRCRLLQPTGSEQRRRGESDTAAEPTELQPEFFTNSRNTVAIYNKSAMSILIENQYY